MQQNGKGLTGFITKEHGVGHPINNPPQAGKQGNKNILCQPAWLDQIRQPLRTMKIRYSGMARTVLRGDFHKYYAIKKPPELRCNSGGFNNLGAPGRIRTCYPRIRSPILYPDELQAQEALRIYPTLPFCTSNFLKSYSLS